MTVFLEIKSAFDCALHSATLKAMISKGYPLYLVKLVKDFLTARRGKITIGDHQLEENIPPGCPQGSVLSSFLWITLMDTVFDLKFTFVIPIITYSDDLNVSCTETNPIQAAHNMQTFCNLIVEWLQSIKLTINAAKSTFIMFDCLRKRNHLTLNQSRS